MRRTAIIIGFYIIIAIVTFGHSASELDAWQTANCVTAHKRLNTDSDCYPHAWAVGMTSAIAWPLYWSWELWES